jgi:hypothetical protein
MDLSARQQHELRVIDKRLARDRRLARLADLVSIRGSHPLRCRFRLLGWRLRYERARRSNPGDAAS